MARIFLCLCVPAAALAFFRWPESSQIKHYTVEELTGVTCEELGVRHEEVIFAYHDAEIAYYKRTGVFHDDLGLPQESVLPIIALMRQFMEENNIQVADIAAPRSSSTAYSRSRFYYEITAVCASNPLLGSVEAMRQAAVKLNLID